MTDIATLGLEVKSDGIVTASDRLKQLTAEGGKAEQATGKLSSSFANATKYIQAAVAAMAAWKLTEYAKEATLLAARVETLGVVMGVVGNNAGYTSRQMQEYDKAVQKMGITTQESRANLIKMAGSQMELAKATQLARVAQDAAVIGNINSSEAFGRMIQGIRSGETEILKNIGINVQFEQAYKKAAATLGKTSEQMTGAEKVTARMNAVLDYGKNIAGAYEASMGTAGKQLNSMSRYTEELRLKFGETFTPALSFVVVELTNALKDADTMLGKNKSTVDEWGQNFKSVVVSVAAEITRLSMLIDKAGGSMTSAAMLLFAPGSAMGNENSKKQFERFAQANMDYEARYKAGEDRLTRLAMSEMNPGTTGRTSAQEQASIDAAAQAKAKEAAEAAAEAAKKGAEAAKKWASTYEQLRKEIDLLNPSMTELDRKILDVTQKYADLERKKGANIEKLRQLKAEHVEAIRTQYELSEAIKQTSRDFQEYLRISGEDKAISQTADAIDEQHRAFRESIRTMDSAARAAKDVSDAVYDINRAFDEAGKSGAIEAYINNLFRLKELQNSTADTTISMISDPYEQQSAMIEARYQREIELIGEKMNALREAGLEESAIYQALTEDVLAKAQKRDKDLLDNQLKQSKAGWDGVVAQAQKAFPKLTGLDKALNAVFKDHTVKRLATEEERAKGAEKLVKDETRSNLSMYGAYAGAAGAMFEGLAATQDQTSREGFESAKALNIAAAVMNTASAIMQQLASMPGPAGWAGAALAAATGAIQIATISSTTFGGGAQAPSAPSGSFASAGIASGGASGFGNLTTPLMSVYDSQTDESLQRLTESTDNAAVAIGRLSTGIDRLTSLFSEGGAGMGLASNMPGRFADLSGSKQINPFGMTALMSSLKDGAFMNGVGTAALTLVTGGLSIVLGSLFGSENRLMGSGIQLAVKDGVVQALNYEDREQGSWWGGSKRVIYTSPNEEAGEFMQALVTPMRNEIDRMALALGTVANASAVNISATSILGSGATPEEAAKALEEWTLKYLQSIAMTVEGLSEFVGAYDDAYAKLIEYNNAVVSTNTAFELIGKAQLQGSLKTGEFLAAVQRDLFGGMEGFNEAVENYFSIMFTDTEQEASRAAVAAKQVERTFAELWPTLGIVHKSLAETSGTYLPKTREEFRALVDGLDITTVAGAQAFAALMDISEAFGLVMTAADEAAEKLKEIQSAMQDLDVRYLKATGQGEAADALARQLSGQREIKQAIAGNMGDAYINRLREVLALEAAAVANSADPEAELKKLTDARYSYELQAFDRVKTANQKALAEAEAALRASVNAEKQSLTNSYNAAVAATNQQISSLNTSVSELGGYVSKLRSAADRMQLQDTAWQRTQYAAAQAMLAATLTAARGGDLSSLKNMDESLDILTSQGTDAYANSADYQRDFWQTKNSIKELEKLAGSQLSDAQQAVAIAQASLDTMRINHDSQLAALDAQLNATLGISDSILTLADAITQYQTAKQFADLTNQQSSMLSELGRIQQAMDVYQREGRTDLYDNAIIYQASKIAEAMAMGINSALVDGDNRSRWDGSSATGRPNSYDPFSAGLQSYAVGTSYVPHDMLANIHQGEIVMDRQSADVLRRYGIQTTGAADNRELVAEVRALRAELRAAQTEIAKNTLKTARYIERWDGDGLPEERAAA